MNIAARACERVAPLDEKVKYLNSRSSQSRALIVALKLGGIWLCVYTFMQLYIRCRRNSLFPSFLEKQKESQKRKKKVRLNLPAHALTLLVIDDLVSLVVDEVELSWICDRLLFLCISHNACMRCETARSQIHRSVVTVNRHAFKTLKF